MPQIICVIMGNRKMAGNRGNGRTNGCISFLEEGLNMTYVIDHLEYHNSVMNPKPESVEAR